jgi:hypothetical protein
MQGAEEQDSITAYVYRLKEYKWALGYEAGGGHRGTQLVEWEYDRLVDAHGQLASWEKAKVEALPTDPRLRDKTK